MHFGLVSIGLILGGATAAAVFNLGGSMYFAIICYSIFGFVAVCFGASIWAMTPKRGASPVPIPKSLRPFVEPGP